MKESVKSLEYQEELMNNYIISLYDDFVFEDIESMKKSKENFNKNKVENIFKKHKKEIEFLLNNDISKKLLDKQDYDNLKWLKNQL